MKKRLWRILVVALLITGMIVPDPLMAAVVTEDGQKQERIENTFVTETENSDQEEEQLLNETETDKTDNENKEPGAADPDNKEPGITDPDNKEPETTDPDNKEPEITDPDNKEPEITDPDNKEPEITDPETTDPEITDPEPVIKEKLVIRSQSDVLYKGKMYEFRAWKEFREEKPDEIRPDQNEPETIELQAVDVREIGEPETEKPENSDPEVTEPETEEPESVKPEQDLKPQQIDSSDLIWKSSNSSVASVNKKGYVSAKKKGKATIEVCLKDHPEISAKKKIRVMEEMVVVLDAGHGGHDSGAVSRKYHLVERNMNLDFTLACKEELEKYEGIRVYLTRSTNSYYPSLTDRTRLAHQKHADLFLSLHTNDGYSAQGGAEVYESVNPKYRRTGLAKKILKNLSKEGMKNRGVKRRASSSGRDYYSVIRTSAGYKIPGMIIEHGFIGNKKDVSHMNTKAKRKALGRADAKAVADYYDLPLKKKKEKPEVPYKVFVDKLETPDTSILMKTGASKKIRVSVLPSKADQKKLEWESSKPSVVKLTGKGNIKAVKPGVSYITVKTTDGSGRKLKIKVTVRRMVSRINVKKSRIVLKKGRTAKVYASVVPKNATVKKLSYSSSRKRVATVNSKGVIKARRRGTATIYVKATDGSKKVRKIKVVVKK